MELGQFEALLAQKAVKKGCFTSIIWQSDVTLRAAYKDSYDIKKVTQGVARLGVNYGHIKEIRERGTEPQSLPYGAWKKGKENIIIEHNGGYQLRMTKTNNFRHKGKVAYYLNGVEIAKDKLQEMNVVVPSYWDRGGHETPVFNVKLENVLKIGRE